MLAHQTIAWLLTYLLHGTLLLGLAWLVSKPLSRWSVHAEETVWKLALVGALFTATLQIAAGWEPLTGRWNLAQARTAAEEAAPVRTEAIPAPAPAIALEIPMKAAAEAPSRFAAPPAPRPHLSLPSIPALALGAWAMGALLLLVGYVRSFARLGQRLKNRPRVVGGTLHSQLRSLAAEAGFPEDVELSCSSRVPVPLALGLRQPEICVPPRALAGLTDEQQEGMLAHELAHLARRDPLWLVLSHVLACIFFFQPLNWVARRRLREISEMLSDEWAVTRTGRPLSLAGCLAEVAGWSVSRRSLPVPGMADRPSHLAQRIRRLLESRSPESPARRIWLGAAMVVLLIAVAAAAPAVSAAREKAAAKPEKTAAKAVQTNPADTPKTWLDDSSEPGAHEVAEEKTFDRHENADDDFDVDTDTDTDVNVDLDVDVDPDVDVDVDVDVDPDIDVHVEAAVETSMAALDRALEAMDGQLEGLSEEQALTKEDREKLKEEMERTSQRLEQLSREMSEKMSRQLPTPEMRKLEDEMKKLADQMRPSEEEMARLRAHVDEEVRKHRADGELSREERQRIAREAREMAERMRPTEEQRKAMEDLRRLHHELAQQFTVEHREEIEKATREMREDIQREMDAVRQELRRATEERRLREREERRELRQERDRDPKRDKEESGKEKPPKMVLRIDMWGNLKLEPEKPGC